MGAESSDEMNMSPTVLLPNAVQSASVLNVSHETLLRRGSGGDSLLVPTRQQRKGMRSRRTHQ